MIEKAPIFKRYSIRFLAGIVSFLILTVTVTTLVDPWRVLRRPWSLDSLDGFRDYSDHHRTGKAGLAKDPKGWDIAYVGSSRVEMGLPTNYPAFAGKRVVNLGLGGGLIAENTAMAKFVMSENPGLETILFSVDTGDLTSRADLRAQSDFYRSPLAPDQSVIEKNLSYAFGVRALTESFAVISNSITGRKSKYSPTGQRVGGLGEPMSLRAYLPDRVAFYKSQSRAFDAPATSPFNDEKFSNLSAFLREARATGVRVILIIPPRHALMQIHPSEDSPPEAPWEIERCRIAALTAEINRQTLSGPAITFLDFCTFSPLTTQALPVAEKDQLPFKEWPDLEHFKDTIGLAVLDRCFGDKTMESQHWGVNVLEMGIGEHLRLLRLGHADYCRAHPEDVAWYRSMIFPGENEPPHPSHMPSKIVR